MHGRMYDPRLGQFLSPDPEIQSPYGQGLNRFAYVFNSPLNNVDPSGFTSEAAYWEAGLGLGVPYTAGLAATLWSTGGGFAASAAAPAATGFMVAGPSAGEVAGAAAPAIATVTAVINTAIATSHQAVHQFKTPSASNRAAHARSVARGNNNNSAVSPRQEKPPVPTPAEPKPPAASDEWGPTPDVSNIPSGYAAEKVNHRVFNEGVGQVDDSSEFWEGSIHGIFEVSTTIFTAGGLTGGKAAVRAGGLFLRASRGGLRFHGDIPNKAALLKKASAALVELREMARASIATREAEMLKLGAKGAHANRLGAERRLLEAVSEILRGRGVP